MRWLILGAPVVLAAAAGWWLSTGRYRRPDDERHRRPPWWMLPVLVALAVLAAAPFYTGRPLLVIGTYALALVWGGVLAFIDLEVRRLPDRLTLPAYPVVAALLAGCSVVTGDWAALLRAVTCAGVAVAAFLAAALFSPGAEGLGLGDVKLAGVLGALLGWIGWLTAVMGLLSGFILGGLVAAVLLVARRADRQSHLSFGPAMVAGAYLWCVLPPVS